MDNKIKEQIISIISDVIDVPIDMISGKNTLEETGLDSLDVVKISLLLEKEFNVKLPIDRFAGVDTLDALVGLIKRLQND
ncbi:MAG: acyl carrier protein [Pseudomonadota bacterium]